MNVVICVDPTYALPLFALLHSLSGHESSRAIDVFIIGSDLPPELVNRIERASIGHLKRVSYINAEIHRVQHLPLQRWISRAAYLKLLAPGMLPCDAERVILLDADLIVRSDLAPLWEADMQDRLLLAVQDYGCPYVSDSFGIKRYRELGLPADAPYFNSGVMLVDLDRWREEEVERRALDYLTTHAQHLRCHDQEALNVVAAGRWAALDPRWNQMPHIYWAEHLPPSPHREQLLAQRPVIIGHPFIIHFAARQKPWLPGNAHPARRLFLRHLQMSGYLSGLDYLRWRWRLMRDSWRVRTAVMPAPKRPDALAPAPDESTAASEVEAGVPMAGVRYRVLSTTGVASGRNHTWLLSSRSGVARVVPASIAAILFRCDRFRTLDEHAYRAAQAETRRALQAGSGKGHSRVRGIAARFMTRLIAASGAQVPVRREAVLAVRRQLEAFVRDGYLVAEAELFIRVRERSPTPVAATAKPAPVSVLGIPTRDRPELLARALESYAGNLREYGRNVQVIVADDSRKPGSGDANRAVARHVEKEFGIEITVVDHEWRARYAQRLADETGIPLDVVRFAVLGDARCQQSYGAARNTLHLLCAGKMAVHVDDDTLCQHWRVAERSPSTRSADEDGGTQFWFLPEGLESCAGVEPVSVDFIGSHEMLLGVSDSELVGSITAGTLAVEINDPSAGWIAYNRDTADAGGVGVTLGGGVGDSGLRNSWPRLFFEGPSFDRLIGDESGYRDRLATRQIVRLAPRTTVTDSSLCIGMNLGLDHRRLLPPFMPVQRMEDGIFMTVLRRCMPGVRVGHLALAVEHRPAGRADRETLYFDRVGREFQVNDFLQWCILSVGTGRRDNNPEQNFRSLGRYLEAMAELSLREFEVQLRLAGARVLNQQITVLERRLGNASGQRMTRWVNDSARYLQALRFGLILSDLVVPTDLQGRPEERMLTLQALIGQYGALVRQWPDLWQAAERNSASGVSAWDASFITTR